MTRGEASKIIRDALAGALLSVPIAGCAANAKSAR